MDSKPTLVLLAIGDGYEATFEHGAPMYQSSDLDTLRERFYLVIIEGVTNAA